MSTVYFGKAWAEYSTLEVKPLQPEQVFKSRPSQRGSDVVTFEASARTSVGQAYLFGISYAALRTRLNDWTRLQNEVGTLYIYARGGMDSYDSIILRRVRPLKRPRRIALATNNANWQQRIELNVARVT